LKWQCEAEAQTAASLQIDSFSFVLILSWFRLSLHVAIKTERSFSFQHRETIETGYVGTMFAETGTMLNGPLFDFVPSDFVLSPLMSAWYGPIVRLQPRGHRNLDGFRFVH